MIIAAMLSMLAMVYAIVARLIVRRRRPPATHSHTRALTRTHTRAPQIVLSPGVVHWGWRYSFWGCLLLFVARRVHHRAAARLPLPHLWVASTACGRGA